MTIKIKVSRDFSIYPGGRYKSDGEFCGEQFRVKLLIPKLKEAEHSDNQLIIDINDVAGYGACFLEEVFGGLVRATNYKKDWLLETIKVRANKDYLFYKKLIQQYIINA